MRIFVAGATGVIGAALAPLLVYSGHTVAGMTRTPQLASALETAGIEPVVCDVYDRERLIAAVGQFAPEDLIHQLTDLPDDAAEIPAHAERNLRIRTEGTANLLAAAQAAGASRILVQSIAWKLAGPRAEAMETFERSVLDAGGVVIRYGQLYGPGTYYAQELPDGPRIAVTEAARRTAELLDAPSGVVELVE
jgi:Nucleoside-diphosphate-sugar epimerases